MSDRIIDKDAAIGFLNELLSRGPVFAPVSRNGIVSFEPVENGDQISLDYRNARQAPKEIFFPRSETLFLYERGEITPVSPAEEQRVVVGIRPCDARAGVLLDHVFDSDDVEDPYYVKRRESTVLIGLTCADPLHTCFCTSLGGGPASTEGLDLLWTDLGDRYLVEVTSERGEGLILTAGEDRFGPVNEADQALKAAIVARAQEAVGGPNVEGIKEKLDAMYDAPYWEDLHQKCLGCGACTYLCPTCHCFDIVDEGNATKGRRVRNWDTCQLALFTAHASGHNPRPSGRERMRQRMMHKFNYFVANFSAIACVGCGRCVRECPVNLDIRAVIEAIGQIQVEEK